MPRTPHPTSARARVLATHQAGDDLMLVADHNGIPPTTARRIIATGREELRPRGGARRASTKCTPGIEQALEEYLEDNCSYTLNATRDMVRFDFGKGERATVVLPPSKSANLQVQCAVSTETGLVHYRLQRGSIRMDVNAEFINEIKVKASPTYHEHFLGKKVVVVLDNTPAHNQSEDLVTDQDDLMLLRLAPYSPMCNPNEGRQSLLCYWTVL
eukprot:jgi/Phyca11/130791/e_gw1.98.96.1